MPDEMTEFNKLILADSREFLDVTPLVKGGFGFVFLAKYKDKNVALKVIKTKIGSPDPRKEEILLKQCSRVKGVNKFVESFYLEERLQCLVLESFPYQMDLFNFITEYYKSSDSNGIPSPIIQHIFSEIVRINKELSDMMIFHFDIKDENVLLSWDQAFNKNNHINPTVTLIDFGNAKKCTTNSRLFLKGKFQPTNVYAPPEYLKCNQIFPLPFTVWTLGVLLFDMLTGNIPFDNDKQTVGLSHIWPKNPKEELFQQAKQLTNLCLDKNHKTRIEFSELLVHPFIKK